MGKAECVIITKRNSLAKLWHWWKGLAGWGSRPSRQLRLRETLALGERRFIAVVEFEQRKFLIGGTGNSVAMLAALPSEGSAQPSPQSEPLRDEVPTWAFSSPGPASPLIRR